MVVRCIAACTAACTASSTSAWSFWLLSTRRWWFHRSESRRFPASKLHSLAGLHLLMMQRSLRPARSSSRPATCQLELCTTRKRSQCELLRFPGCVHPYRRWWIQLPGKPLQRPGKRPTERWQRASGFGRRGSGRRQSAHRRRLSGPSAWRWTEWQAASRRRRAGTRSAAPSPRGSCTSRQRGTIAASAGPTRHSWLLRRNWSVGRPKCSWCG